MVVRFFLEPSEQSVILSEKRTTAHKGGLIIGIVSYPVTLLFLIGILSCSCIANNSYNRHITTKKLSDPYLYFSFQFTKIFLQKSMQSMTTTGMRKAILWRTAFKSGVPESSEVNLSLQFLLQQAGGLHRKALFVNAVIRYH